MKIGASYYPELFSPAQWREDLLKGREVGLEVLRCGEFAWEFIEPEDGKFQFDWINNFLSLAGELGYSVIWCTPSATPPPRFFSRWPDMMGADTDGNPMLVAHRRNYSPAHQPYRERCREMAGRLALELHDNPVIVGWQVDNELAGGGTGCWGGKHITKAFQEYLRDKFVTLDEFNLKIGGGVWSKVYRAWDDIKLPGTTGLKGIHPELRLEFQRYQSKVWHEFYYVQYTALKKGGITVPITTNLYDLSWNISFDMREWRPDLDVVGIGNYMEGELENQFQLALLRNIAQERALWVMEQKAGQQKDQNYYPDDPSTRLVDHLRRCREAGAEYAIYWHLKQHCHGCEMAHGAVLNHDGRIGRIGRAVKQAIETTSGINPVPLRKDVAMLFDYQQYWVQKQRRIISERDYRHVLQDDYFAALRSVYGTPSIIGADDLDNPNLKLVLIPHFQLDRGATGKILACAERGATVVLTADYAIFDDFGAVNPTPLLDALRPELPIPDMELLRLADDSTLITKDGLGGGIFYTVPFGKIEISRDDTPSHFKFPYGKGKVIILNSGFGSAELEQLLESWKEL